ncbi:MAG: hypothetical protein R2731_05550 [Nocardioides sp.]
MRSTRTVLVGALVWVSVVALGSTMVWTVISRAGRDLVVGQPNPVASTGAAQRTGDGFGLPSSPPPIVRRPTRSAGPSEGPGASSSATGPPGSQTPDSGPGSPPSSSSSPGGGGGGGGGTPPAVTDRQIWRGEGGTVEMKCTGTAISIVSSYAYPGFQKIIGADGPQQVEVKFVGQEDGEHHEDEMHAVCGSDGKLDIQSDSTDGEGGDD